MWYFKLFVSSQSVFWGRGCEITFIDPHVDDFDVVKGVFVADDELEVDELVDDRLKDEEGVIFVKGEVFALVVDVLAFGLAVSKEAQIADTKSRRATEWVDRASGLILDNGEG